MSDTRYAALHHQKVVNSLQHSLGFAIYLKELYTQGIERGVIPEADVAPLMQGQDDEIALFRAAITALGHVPVSTSHLTVPDFPREEDTDGRIEGAGGADTSTP